MRTSQTNSQLTSTLAASILFQLRYYIARGHAIGESIKIVEGRTTAGSKPWAVALTTLQEEHKYNG